MSSTEILRRQKISANNAKFWLGKKRPDMATRFLGEGNPMFGRKASKATRKKMSESHKRRLRNHQYTDPKTTKTAYGDVHKWIYRQMGRPQQCNHCGTTEKRMYHWANVSGDYMRDVTDWVRLCVPCHKRYDLGRCN